MAHRGDRSRSPQWRFQQNGWITTSRVVVQLDPPRFIAGSSDMQLACRCGVEVAAVVSVSCAQVEDSLGRAADGARHRYAEPANPLAGDSALSDTVCMS